MKVIRKHGKVYIKATAFEYQRVFREAVDIARAENLTVDQPLKDTWYWTCSVVLREKTQEELDNDFEYDILDKCFGKSLQEMGDYIENARKIHYGNRLWDIFNETSVRHLRRP